MILDTIYTLPIQAQSKHGRIANLIVLPPRIVPPNPGDVKAAR